MPERSQIDINSSTPPNPLGINSLGFNGPSSGQSVSDPQLKYPLDPVAKKIVDLEIDDHMPSIAVDVQWNNYFYFSSIFESLDRYFTIIPSTGNISINQDGLHTVTKAAVGDRDETAIYIKKGTLVDLSKKSRFKTAAYLASGVGAINQCELFIVSSCSDPVTSSSGALPTGTAYIGFVVDKGIVYGVTSDGTTTTKLSLGKTVVLDEIFTLEYRFLPGNKVAFFVNDVHRGDVSTTLPLETFGSDRVIMWTFTYAYDAAVHDSQVIYYEYIQEK